MLLRITTLLTLLTVASIGRAQERHPIKCVTPHQVRNPKAPTPLFAFPTNLTESALSPTGRFLIHYDSASATADSVTAPDFLQRALEEADSAYDFEVIQLGYPAPAFTRGTHYDIFLAPIHRGLQTFGAYGATFVLDENPLTASPSGNERRRSFVEIDNSFTDSVYYTRGMDALRITIFHEFFHLLQFADFGWPLLRDVYFQEMSSVWMEWLSTAYVKDYLQYTTSYLRSLDLRFDLSPDLGIYGEYLFNAYLSRRYDTGIVKEIWANYRDSTSDPVTAIDMTLRHHGSSFCDGYMRFGEELTKTGWRKTGWQASRISILPDAELLLFDSVHVIPVQSDAPLPVIAVALSLQFYDMRTSGHDCIAIIARDTDRSLQTNDMLTFHSDGTYALAASQPMVYCDTEDCIALVDPSVTTFPNPFVLNGIDSLLIPALSIARPPIAMALDIFTLDQRLVRHLDETSGPVLKESWCATWDGLDDLGHAVESGEYIYKLRVDGALKVGKIVVVRR